MTKDDFLKNPENYCKYVSFDTVIVGSGAAGLNAALKLNRYGEKNVLVLTEGTDRSTSRNTGSDKQTYYKLSLSGNCPDSPYDMAKDIFAGKAVDGDVAYAEAAGSAGAFYDLVNLGVPFPTNRYGEYVGYRTDHDVRPRATSVGPLTSKIMTLKLEDAVKQTPVTFYERYKAVKIIKDEKNTVSGLFCVSLSDNSPLFIKTKNIILATGGPAGIFADKVYPVTHSGSTGLAIEAGAKIKNLTEWQFGLASVSPRWNVSGSYMQVLPRFVSVDKDGNEYDFLESFFETPEKALDMIFKKGYEWPFDCRKVRGGSSVIDLLVYNEKVNKKRRVFLDFTENPGKTPDISYEKLSQETYGYLKNAGVCFGKPIDRLISMNEPAYELYLSKGVDLKKRRLEIALCAQHCNGGVDVDLWWQSSIEGLFAAGEAAGTHGVYRPGGSALNAGQVGANRAALFISEKGRKAPVSDNVFLPLAFGVLSEYRDLVFSCMSQESNLDDYVKKVTSLMTDVCGAVRKPAEIKNAIACVFGIVSDFKTVIKIKAEKEIPKLLSFRDLLFSAYAMLFAVSDYFEKGGLSRGSAIYSGSGIPYSGLPEEFAFSECDGRFDDKIQDVFFDGKEMRSVFRDVRPLPEGGGFFETVWKEYRNSKNVF